MSVPPELPPPLPPALPSYILEPRRPPTVQQVAAGYDAMIIVRRWFGAWIDFITLVCFLLVPDYVLGNAVYRQTLAVWLTLIVVYFPLTESLFGGSLGKFASGTRVVDEHGRNPSLLQVLARTLLRLFEVNPLLLGGIPAGICVAMTAHKQRIGDLVAHTYVVTAADRRRVRDGRSGTFADSGR